MPKETLDQLLKNSKKMDAGKINAAYTLIDEIVKIAFKLERADAVLQDMRDGYFNNWNPETAGGRFSIAYEYRRYGIFADIVSDYLLEIEKGLEALSDMAGKGADMRKAARND